MGYGKERTQGKGKIDFEWKMLCKKLKRSWRVN